MFASMLRRSPMLGRTAAVAPMMYPMGPAQSTLLRMASCASFAKYQRTKPHLNVGTIGKFRDTPPHDAVVAIELELNAPQFFRPY